MSEKTINFGDKKISKKDFYNNKKQFNIEDIDINKIFLKMVIEKCLFLLLIMNF